MISFLLSLGLAAGLAGAPDSTELRGEALATALRSGGYTIMLRHAQTDRSVNEGANYASLPRAQQRNLNDEGVRTAKLIGAVMKRFEVPVGEILSSEMYRTRETAEYVFGEPTHHAELQQPAQSAAQRALIVSQPKPGTNRAIVTHHFIIEGYAPGIRPGDIAEGEAAVVRAADDGTLKLIGRFKLADWQALAPAPGAAEANAGQPAHRLPPPQPSSTGPAAAIPQTRAGRIAEAYLRAFNTGNDAVMRAFVASSMVPNPERPTEARLESYRKLWDALGALVPASILSSDEDALEFTVRSKQGDIPVSVKTAIEKPGRLVSLSFKLTRDGN